MTETETFLAGPLPHLHIGSIHIPLYFLVISLTSCVCIYWFYRRCENRDLSLERALNLCLLALIFGFIGARLAHVLWEAPDYYREHPERVFSVFSGGYVYYGGLILGYLSCWLYLWRSQADLWRWHDVAAPVLSLGYALGRMACFLTGCCYGQVCEWPWAMALQVVDPQKGVIATSLRHPTPLYAIAVEVLALLFILRLEKKKTFPGQVFLLWLTLHALGRLLMEHFRDDPRGPEVFAMSISSFLSLAMILIASIFYFAQKRKNQN